MKKIGQDFYISNVRNPDAIFIYSIFKTRQTGKNDLPTVEFTDTYLNINNIRFQDPIYSDITAYNILKNKSNHSENFLIKYNEFIDNYRVYTFNVNRQTHDDNSNKFMNIISNLDINEDGDNTIVYIVWRNYATITMKYDKNNGFIVYKIY